MDAFRFKPCTHGSRPSILGEMVKVYKIHCLSFTCLFIYVFGFSDLFILFYKNLCVFVVFPVC